MQLHCLPISSQQHRHMLSSAAPTKCEICMQIQPHYISQHQDESFKHQKNSCAALPLGKTCRAMFGPGIPRMEAPSYARGFMRLLHQVGGVVFTNGDLDGWAGGSLGVTSTNQQDDTGDDQMPYGQPSPERHQPARRGDTASVLGSANLTSYEDGPDDSTGCGFEEPSCPGVSYVVYRNASHCTDVHTYAYQTPGEPSAWKQQRAQAIDRAVAFAGQARSVERQRPRE